MKFTSDRPYGDPEAAARKLLEIANSVQAVQDGRIHIEKINWPFLHELRGSPAELQGRARSSSRAGMDRLGTVKWPELIPTQASFPASSNWYAAVRSNRHDRR